MQIAVIDADYRMGEPALHLVERHRRASSSGSRSPLLAHVREGRAGQQMDLAHHRADQPLDMPAIVRRAHRPIVDAIPYCSQPRFSASEWNSLALSRCSRSGRPWTGQSPSTPRAISQPAFGRAAWAMHSATRRRGRRIERQMEARHASRVDIDRERQPRPLDRLPRHAVDHDHIDQRVVDLDQRQRPRRLSEPVAGAKRSRAALRPARFAKISADAR